MPTFATAPSARLLWKCEWPLAALVTANNRLGLPLQLQPHWGGSWAEQKTHFWQLIGLNTVYLAQFHVTEEGRVVAAEFLIRVVSEKNVCVARIGGVRARKTFFFYCYLSSLGLKKSIIMSSVQVTRNCQVLKLSAWSCDPAASQHRQGESLFSPGNLDDPVKQDHLTTPLSDPQSSMPNSSRAASCD